MSLEILKVLLKLIYSFMITLNKIIILFDDSYNFILQIIPATHKVSLLASYVELIPLRFGISFLA